MSLSLLYVHFSSHKSFFRLN
uniref:Uncharacterized protein n=1 Tax=Rhizophora mucronata TaxID=61149 RepID=A0A2P2J1W5_RHIMU